MRAALASPILGIVNNREERRHEDRRHRWQRAGREQRREAAGREGHDAVPASPATGVDTISGEGLAEVMAGADVVVDVSNAPAWEDDAVLAFFTTSTRNLLAAERAAGVGHHVAVSIVGADRLPDSGYLRAKVAQEAEIEAGLRSLHDPALDAVPRVPAPDRGSRRRGRRRPPPHRADAVRRRRRGRRDRGRARRPARRPTAASSWAGPRRWASTPGRGACSPPRATTARSSPTRTRATSARSCTAASSRPATARASARSTSTGGSPATRRWPLR